MSETVRIGIDLGGTKTEIVALNFSGNEIYRHRVETPASNYHEILNCIRNLVVNTEAHIGCTASIGICTPGSISPVNGLIRNSNTTCLNQKPLLNDLQKILKREVKIENDANCFTLSEAIDGNARYEQIIFGVILGTGCGGSLVIDKKLVAGCNSIAGEWGHNPLPYATAEELSLHKCWCGQYSCLETFLSGTGFSEDYLLATENKCSAQTIIQRAHNGEDDAKQCLSRYEHRLAKSLACVINLLDPHVIVLGGGMSNVSSLYSNIPLIWNKFIFSDTVRTKLISPMYGDSSGVRGAARLWNA